MMDNGTNGTNGTADGTALGFAGRVLYHACPGNDPDRFRAAAGVYLSPIQLMLTACLAVAVLSVVPQLAMRAERAVLDLLKGVSRRCCCCGGGGGSGAAAAAAVPAGTSEKTRSVKVAPAKGPQPDAMQGTPSSTTGMAKEDGADRAGDAEATAVEEGGRKEDVEDATGGIPEKGRRKGPRGRRLGGRGGRGGHVGAQQHPGRRSH